jgi:hypothetical protein
MAGRIRSIKPEWIEDERFNACSDAAIRLAHVFYALVDDDGRCKITVRALGLAGWKFCDRVTDKTAHAQSAVNELVASRWLISYVVGGEQHWCIRNFGKHQVINKRKPSRFEPPPEFSGSDTVAVPYEDGTPPDEHGRVGVDLDQGSGSGSGSGMDMDPRASVPEVAPPKRMHPAQRFDALAHGPVQSKTLVTRDEVSDLFSELHEAAGKGSWPKRDLDFERLTSIADEANREGQDKTSRTIALRESILGFLAEPCTDPTYPLAFFAGKVSAYRALYRATKGNTKPAAAHPLEAAWHAAEKAAQAARMSDAPADILRPLERAAQAAQEAWRKAKAAA